MTDDDFELIELEDDPRYSTAKAIRIQASKDRSKKQCIKRQGEERKRKRAAMEARVDAEVRELLASLSPIKGTEINPLSDEESHYFDFPKSEYFPDRDWEWLKAIGVVVTRPVAWAERSCPLLRTGVCGQHITDDLVWRTIPFATKYECSNYGGIVRDKSNDRLRAGQQCYDGNRIMTLTHLGQSQEFALEFVVASAYIPNPDNFRHVNFLDGDLDNYKIDNLVWSSVAGISAIKQAKYVEMIQDIQPRVYEPLRGERWFPVRSFLFPELQSFFVSNKGRIRTPEKQVFFGARLGTGYYFIVLNRRIHKVHRIVCNTLCTQIEGTKMVCDHVNMVRSDNSAVNLQACSNAENVRRARVGGAHERGPTLRATFEDVGKFQTSKQTEMDRMIQILGKPLPKHDD